MGPGLLPGGETAHPLGQLAGPQDAGHQGGGGDGYPGHLSQDRGQGVVRVRGREALSLQTLHRPERGEVERGAAPAGAGAGGVLQEPAVPPGGVPVYQQAPGACGAPYGGCAVLCDQHPYPGAAGPLRVRGYALPWRRYGTGRDHPPAGAEGRLRLPEHACYDASLAVPQLAHMGGGGGMQLSAPVPQEPDKLRFDGIFRVGGKPAVRTAVPIPEA